MEDVYIPSVLTVLCVVSVVAVRSLVLVDEVDQTGWWVEDDRILRN